MASLIQKKDDETNDFLYAGQCIPSLTQAVEECEYMIL